MGFHALEDFLRRKFNLLRRVFFRPQLSYNSIYPSLLRHRIQFILHFMLKYFKNTIFFKTCVTHTFFFFFFPPSSLFFLPSHVFYSSSLESLYQRFFTRNSLPISRKREETEKTLQFKRILFNIVF